MRCSPVLLMKECSSSCSLELHSRRRHYFSAPSIANTTEFLPRQQRVESSHGVYTASVARHTCWPGGVARFLFHGGMPARKPNPLAIMLSVVDVLVQQELRRDHRP